MSLADTLKTDLNAPITSRSDVYEEKTVAPLREQYITSLKSEQDIAQKKEMQQASSQANLSASMATYDTQASEKLHNDPNLIKYQEAIDQKSKAAFIPDQENPERLATVLAITNLLGIAIGGKGKNSAQTALAAQNGMLEGYQQGRADIIKQQKDIFDTNQKILDKTIENLHRGFQDALALAPTDRKAAEEKAMSTINQENADFLRELYNKTGLVGASKTIAELLKQAESRQKLMQQEEMKMIKTPHEREIESQGLRRLDIMEAKESRESAKGKSDKFIGFTDDGKHAVFSTSEGGIRVALAPEGVDFSKVIKVGQGEDIDSRERQAMLNRLSKEKIANEQIASREKLEKAKQLTGGKLKPGGKIAEGYVADLQLQQDLTDLRNDLNDSKLVKQIKDYRAEAFLSEEGKVLNQLMSSDIPPELSKFLNKVSRVRNNYYLNISGKAVTGGEALRNYGVVSQPGDTPEKMAIKMEAMLENVDQNINTKRQLFTLPEVNRKPGQKTNLTPGQDYNSEETTIPSKTSGGATVSNW
jgi:hypothetical protein